MSSLTNKRILLGVSGGIAAYKSAELIRRLIDLGAEVRVVMTRAAQEFITPMTLQALSGNAVHTDVLDPEAEAAMGHIELARWADLMLIAPATANVIAKIAAGEGSDLLSTLFLACSAPAVVAPAMNQVMWASAATQANMATIQARGIRVFGPAAGQQACGDIGLGRMEEPTAIAEFCAAQFKSEILAAKRVVITAGPTREAIDPVRYLSNHSSGKMGYALAEAAVAAGASVILISGPVHLAVPDRVRCIQVDSAQEMYEVSLAQDVDIFIGAAAVCDYRVEQVAENKMKKDGDTGLQLSLVPNPDIIAAVAEQKANAYVVGFAAETQNVLEYARIKRKSKKLNMIIANDVSDTDIGFNSDNNAVTLITNEAELFLERQNKAVLASQIIRSIAQALD